MDSGWDGDDRRTADRRLEPTRPWRFGRSRARRRGGRRTDDASGYVDRYTRRDVLLLLTVFLLNVGDAFFTMLWLARGGQEANPIMDFFLDIGPGAFLAQKCLVVGFWLVVLVAHKNFRFARIGLYATLVVYGLLMIVHFGIIAFDVQPPVRARAVTPRPAGELGASAHPAPRPAAWSAPDAVARVRPAGRPASE